jgi:molybdate transport system substrate-binding protein
VQPHRAFGQTSAECRIAAAADLQVVMPQLIQAFENAQKKQRLTSFAAKLSAVYGSSGNLFAQIKAGAPFQLFFSADTKLASDVFAQGFAASPHKNYALGRLVLWVHKNLADAIIARDSIRGLSNAAIQRIAIANPAHAPYGQRAREALQYYGVWTQIESKIVLAENVAQAAQYAQTGTVQAALLPLSLVLFSTLGSQGAYQLVSERSHTPLVQSAVVLKTPDAAQKQLATAFVDYCCSAAGQALLQRYGFSAVR